MLSQVKLIELFMSGKTWNYNKLADEIRMYGSIKDVKSFFVGLPVEDGGCPIEYKHFYIEHQGLQFIIHYKEDEILWVKMTADNNLF